MSWDYTNLQIKNLISNPEKSRVTTFEERCLLGKRDDEERALGS
jgi:hypothetical protein